MFVFNDVSSGVSEIAKADMLCVLLIPMVKILAHKLSDLVANVILLEFTGLLVLNSGRYVVQEALKRMTNGNSHGVGRKYEPKPQLGKISA